MNITSLRTPKVEHESDHL